MMNYNFGWMGGWMTGSNGIWTAVGVLVLVLLVVVIIKLLRK
jgi:hypothetical protein